MKQFMIIILTALVLGGPVLAAELPPPAPAPPRTPETGIDPGIQVNPGPSPDDKAVVPPKTNPDPEMAIDPNTVRGTEGRLSKPPTEKKTEPSSPQPKPPLGKEEPKP
jgi:hypothetical protein